MSGCENDRSIRPAFIQRFLCQELPGGVCARWGAFVAERSALAAVGRIAGSCDRLLEEMKRNEAGRKLCRRAETTGNIERYTGTAWRMGGDISTHGL